MHRRTLSGFAVFLFLLPASYGHGGDPIEERFRAGTTFLASPECEGRGVGSVGIGRAADWLERQLREGGFAPAFGKSFRQKFPVKMGVSLAKGNRLSGVADADWAPLGFSSSGSFAGELAFVGYGIEAPPLGFRELDAVDLHGKIALMLRYEPQEKDDDSIFDGRKPSRWSAMRYRVMQARERGATAVVFVVGPLQDEGNDKLPALHNDGPESAAGLPVIQVKTSVAVRWLAKAGIDLADFQKQVDRDLRPRSVARTGVRLSGKVALETTTKEAWNVAGILPGAGALGKEVVVVGAHYDHLGMGGQASMKPNVTAIHPGADDNASGTTAALLAATEAAKSLRDLPSHRTLLVVFFSAEELGLGGSSWFTEHPPVPIGSVSAMVNLDMVGRLRDERLVALGAESAPQWSAELQRIAAADGLGITTKGDGYGPSDQTAFYARRIPVIHFFTGAHEQYHSPEDTADTLNVPGGAKVARFTADVVRELVDGTLSPTYARVAAAPAMEGDSRGYGSWLGTVPDYRAMEDESGGVLLADVRAGGPAEKAGIRGGDRIVEMAGTRIENLYDMTYALQDHKPGQTIDVVVVRDGKKETLRATLGERPKAKEGASPTEPKPSATSAPEPKTAADPNPSAAPSPAPEPKAAPADPHASAPKGEFGGASSFYSNRPGPDFVIGAGRPFEKTFPGERHFADIRQLTFGGENAEAYWSPDGTKLILQSTPRSGKGCDQEFVLDLRGGGMTRVSSGRGRTTCGYFRAPQQDRIVYASTEAASPDCPPTPDQSMGYVWAVDPGYDIYEANPDGSGAHRITETPGYDAEATYCGRGGKMIFTSVRDGDLDLYSRTEGGEVTRLTDTPGYDGGAFYSPDCREIVWRASRPQAGKELDEYRALLAQGLIRPSKLELYLAKADGTGAKQLTRNEAANFCPVFHPDGKRILWSSNVGANKREFDVWMIPKDGGEPERITTADGFDGFQQLSPDGKYIAWGSNRADPASHETNIFVARWVE